MEGNKDFDKEKQEMGTQQMPHVAADGEGDGKRKGTVVLFGHEVSKKKAVMAGLGGLLAIALIGGGIWYATAQEPKDPAPIEQVEEKEQHVIQLGAKADGWVKGESSPVIAHIVNEEQKVDYYHAYDANEPHALDVTAEGEYEVSFISPVDKDGSTYEVPKASKVKSVVEDEDKTVKGDLPFEFKPIAADKTDADALNAIVKSVGEAVKKGDETLTGEKGTKVIELVKENAKANPDADKEKVEEESQKAEEDVTDESSGGSNETPAPEAGGNGNSGSASGGGNGGNSGSNGGSSSSNNGGGESTSQHVHNWVTQTIHHDAQYQTIHHDAVTEVHAICNNCNADITGNIDGHFKENILSGCGSYHTSNIVVQDAWDETVEISPAWDETFTICSSCNEKR